MRGYARMAPYGEFDGKFYAAIVGPRLDPTLNLTQNEDAQMCIRDRDTYDKSVLNAAICIEIDVESGQVYSVFYGTNCKGLYYGSNERCV